MLESTLPSYGRENEADTCRKEVLPKLYASQWTDDLILEQRTFTDGKISIMGRKARRGQAKRFDYLLRYSQNFPLAIVEAKGRHQPAARNRALNTKRLAAMRVPVPVLSIQADFVALLRKVDAVCSAYAAQGEALVQLVPGLLDKAFRGEL